MKHPFYGLKFYSPTTDVLRPYRETELLVDTALRYLKDMDDPVICEIGVGCGGIIISILKNIGRPVKAVATDISEKALDVARTNAETHGVEIEFMQADMAEGLADSSFDLVVCNPAYCHAEESDMIEGYAEPIGPRVSYDGGADGLSMVNRMLDELPRTIKPNGVLIIELNDGQSQYMHDKALGAGLFRMIEVVPDHIRVGRCMTMRKFA